MLAALADSLYILSQAVSFVNIFFHFSLQTGVCRDQIQAVSARSELVYYTALFLICQALFSSQRFSFSGSSERKSAPQVSLTTILCQAQIVKCFFDFFESAQKRRRIDPAALRCLFVTYLSVQFISSSISSSRLSKRASASSMGFAVAISTPAPRSRSMGGLEQPPFRKPR